MGRRPEAAERGEKKGVDERHQLNYAVYARHNERSYSSRWRENVFYMIPLCACACARARDWDVPASANPFTAKQRTHAQILITNHVIVVVASFSPPRKKTKIDPAAAVEGAFEQVENFFFLRFTMVLSFSLINLSLVKAKQLPSRIPTKFRTNSIAHKLRD